MGAVQVLPIWNGPGTVKVILLGTHKKPVDSAIVQSCQEHMERVRPIGAQVTVESAGDFFGQRGRRPAIGGRRRAGNGESRVSQKTGGIFPGTCSAKVILSHNRVAFLLLSIPGVDNFTALFF